MTRLLSVLLVEFDSLSAVCLHAVGLRAWLCLALLSHLLLSLDRDAIGSEYCCLFYQFLPDNRTASE